MCANVSPAIPDGIDAQFVIKVAPSRGEDGSSYKSSIK